jgi:hypothetical protein
MKLTPESTRVLYANSEGGTVVLIVNHVTAARRWEVYERGKTSSRAASLKERQQFEHATNPRRGHITTREEWIARHPGDFIDPSLTHRAAHGEAGGPMFWQWHKSEADAREWLISAGAAIDENSEK